MGSVLYKETPEDVDVDAVFAMLVVQTRQSNRVFRGRVNRMVNATHTPSTCEPNAI